MLRRYLTDEGFRVSDASDGAAMHAVFDAVVHAAERRGVQIDGSELIGLIPQAALDASKGYDFRWINMRSDLILETCLSASR